MAAAPAAVSDWTSSARARNLHVEHAAVGSAEERVLYHMELELSVALADGVEATGDHYVSLSWPYGGLWRVTRVATDRMRVWCLAWRKGRLTAEQFEKHELNIAALAMRGWILDGRQRRAPNSDRSLNEPRALPTVFKWKMMRGNWGTEVDHWFLKALEPPQTTDACQNQLVAKLFVGFAALEAQIEVNAITAIDTVAQTYAADVTWQATLPAITTVQNLALLTEFLTILEVDMAQFEFSNITELKSKQELSTSVTDAGIVHFLDAVRTGESVLESGHHRERVFHLQFSQRVMAVFTDEMALRTFPFDQQKLAFELTTGTSGLPDGPLRLIPTPARPGSFTVANFHLGNVFNLAYHDKIFVNKVVEFGPRKSVVFELVLERKSTYYVKNVALVAAIITYLCFFVSWVPADKQGNAMETGTRLQNATAMVLTAVTFKNQVSSLVPQISYFTILDSYVSVCFLVTSFVTLESALYPLVEGWVGTNWSETTLLGYALLLFTVMNVVWAAYIARWVYHRRQAAAPVMQVYEFIRVITAKHPAAYREKVVEQLLEAREIPTWCRPHWLVTAGGDMHVLAPDDIPEDTYVTHCLVRGMRRRAAARKKNREDLVERQKQIADNAEKEIEAIYTNVRGPGINPPQSSTKTIPTARVSDKAYQAGARQLARLASSVCSLDEDANNDEVAAPRLSTQELVEEAAATMITHAMRNRRHDHADAA